MAGPAAVPAAAVGGVYVGGAALLAGAVYLMTPAGQRASASLGEAIYDGGAAAVDNITDLLSSDDVETPAVPTTGATTTTDTTTCERGCDWRHFWHFTRPEVTAAIRLSNVMTPGLGGGVYFAESPWGPMTVFYSLFIGNPLYLGKEKSYTHVAVDGTVPIAFAKHNFPSNEYLHPGALRAVPGHVLFIDSGPNIFAEHPQFLVYEPYYAALHT
ncbi:hypothetical protein [Parasulfitobacter algicola]|uniref:Uncharacterized protein n=1 Tax=Parasulfitobacter algicola TaxID=2614809 RepID=A0ABX2IZB7_9RHOB|nr:hypothetical protein [Sulfitobacter algicola]NSX56064.1 hypothetical protein [Sulfitobacter algicola]